MVDYLDLKALNEELLALLEKYELKPKILSLSMVLSTDLFDAIANDHPHHKNPGILQTGHTDSKLQWGILIRREMKLEEFPPGAILTPPSD